MKILEALQGSPEWSLHRSTHFNASDAPVMVGVSKYKTRNQLLQEMATGICTEIDANTQKRFDDGHAAERLARRLAEEIVGQELYPVVGYVDEYSASFDGLTIAEDVAWEHKSMNDEIRACKTAADLPPMYRIQMEQQLMVSGAGKCLFMASKWEGDTLIEEKHFWYEPDLKLRAEIRQAWIQFKRDLAAYQHVEVITAAVPTPVKALPAIVYKLNGLALSSNLIEFKLAAERLVEDSKAPLQTDQDFSDRETLVKSFKEAEDKIALVQEQVVGEIKDVDAFCRDLGHISALIRQARLNGEKQIQARKDAIRLEILRKGQAIFAAHVLGLNTRLGKSYLPAIAVDFGNAMKGKRTIASLQDAVDTELARAKIEANSVADRIQTNLATMRELGTGNEFLFSDTAQIVLKAPDDLTALVTLRIAEHKAKEEKRIEEERWRIRAEEVARIEAERIAAEKKVATIVAPAVPTQTPQPASIPAAQSTPIAAKPAVTLVKGMIRPPDETIISLIATHYRVSDAIVIGWLKEMAIFQKEVA